jgi:dynein heavy chain
VLRYFREKDFPKILKIAETMKKNIDDFRPYVPLAVALRKDGMKERHWDQISEKVKFDIRPAEGFTLTSVIDMGMLKHIDVCEEVGERAYKEFHIEKSLIKMQKDWNDSNFALP